MVELAILEETALLFIVMALNLVILGILRIALLQISFGFISAVIAVRLVNVMIFPLFNLLLILICIFQIYNAIQSVRKPKEG